MPTKTKQKLPARSGRRTYKKLTAAQQKQRLAWLEQLEAERPETEVWAAAVLKRMKTIDRVVAALRQARAAKGMSLSQVEEASGLGRSNVSRLENSPDPNPTLETLMTYADALGVELRVAVVDKKTGVPIEG